MYEFNIVLNNVVIIFLKDCRNEIWYEILLNLKEILSVYEEYLS